VKHGSDAQDRIADAPVEALHAVLPHVVAVPFVLLHTDAFEHPPLPSPPL
jgi:hypothetical protein